MSELLNCPFCGGEVELFMDNYGKYAAGCNTCGLYVGVALECGVEFVDGWRAVIETEDDLRAAWNRRAKPEEGAGHEQD